MASDISVSADDVREALNGDASESYTFEIRQAEAIVNDELVAYSDNDERLELVGILIAAAYAEDDGNGNLSSVTQGTAQVSWNNEDALSFWRRAKQMDPTDRLKNLEKGSFKLQSSDVRGTGY